MTAEPRPRRDGKILALLIIVLMGPLLLVMFPAIPFLNDSYCDPWYIFGSYYLLPDMAHWRPETRQIARLPEILPGYALTHLFHGIAADYLLFLSYYGVSLALIYKTARVLLAPGTALFALIFFAAHPLIIGNYSITMDTPAIVYNIATLCLLSCAMAAQSRSRKLWAVFGASLTLGLAIHAHLGMASFAFANYVMFFCYELGDRRTGLARRLGLLLLSCVITVGGLAIVTGLLGLFFVVALDGKFWQCLNQFFQIVRVSRSNAEHYMRPDWYKAGSVAGILAGGVLISLLNIAGLRRRGDQSPAQDDLRRRVSALSIAVLVLIVAQICYSLLGGIFVEYDYYYVFFVPYVSLIVFSPLATLRDQRWAPPYGLVLGFLAAALGAISIKWQTLPWLYGNPRAPYIALALAVLAASVYGLSLAARGAPRYSTPLYLAIAILMLAVTRPEAFGIHIWTEAAGSQRRDDYVRIRQGMEFLSHLSFVADSPKFWVDDHQNPGELAAFPRSYFYCGFNPFPDLDPAQQERFLPNDDIVVIADGTDLLARAKEAFSRLGLAVTETASSIVDFGGRRYEILVEHASGK